MELVRFVLGVLSILLTQLVLAGALVGIGLAVRRGFGLRRLRPDDCFLAFWVGLACVTLFLLLWNLFLPVAGAALPVVLAAGALGIAATWSELARLFEEKARRPSAGVLAILLLIGLWLANLSLGPLNNYDSGLYHIQVVRWAESYPAVPGLANLYGPLAYNNANLLFDALLSAGPWKGRANHLANGLLILGFLFQSTFAGARLAAGDWRPRRLFEFLLFAPAAAMALHGQISSFVTDTAPVLVVMVAVTLLYAMFSEESEAPEDDAYKLVALAALLALAVTFKSNAGFFAAACLPLALYCWLRRHPEPRLRRRTLGWAFAAILALATAWMARGVVLSGYPLFPTAVAGFPVEWRVPLEHVKAEFAFVVNGARASTHNLAVVAGQAGFTSWFPRWIPHAYEAPFEIAVPFALALSGALALARLRGRVTPKMRSQPAGSWWILTPLLLAIGAWFAIAPEARYARGYFWCLAALLWCQAFRLRLAAPHRLPLRFYFWAAVLLAFSPLPISPLVSVASPYRDLDPLQAIVKTNLNRPGKDLWFQTLESKPILSTYRTRSGLLLNTVKNQCWDAPLPCTPNPAPNLRLRRPPDLGKGFVIDGPWEMQNWPTGRQPDFLRAWRESNAGRAAHQQSFHSIRL